MELLLALLLLTSALCLGLALLTTRNSQTKFEFLVGLSVALTIVAIVLTLIEYVRT